MSSEPTIAASAVQKDAAARSVLVIFNPTAGKRRKRRLDRALQRLDARGVAYEVWPTTAAGDARSFARNAEGFDIVAVAGGDGTINEAANGLVARLGGATAATVLPALAIIPLGTANVLAAEIGFDDFSPEAAADAIAGGEIRPAWLGVANDRVFCQMAGVGFDAHVVAEVDLALKRRLGKTAYAIETLRQLWLSTPTLYDVEIDGTHHVAASAIVANGHFYAGRFVCVPDATIDAPDLKVCLFTRAGRWHVLRYAWGVLSGRVARFADVEIVAGRRIRIAARDAGARVEPVQGDGDIIARLPVDISLAPGQIGIVRPL